MELHKFPGLLTLFIIVVITKGSSKRYLQYLMYNYKCFIYIKRNYNTNYLIDQCYIYIYKVRNIYNLLLIFNEFINL